eukprot:GHVP01012281.1.p2 GENE.GHVP01012281.1~~GHVP01012281.1.p2  ORF type:complete len:471 (+),score=87.28 GHVP01012281.1:1898-3310(+)
MENFQASLFFLPFNTFQDFQLENSLTEGNHFNDFLDLRKSTSSWNWKIGTACVSGIILAAVAKVYFSRQTLEESRVYGSQTPSTQETAPLVTHGLSGNESTSTPFSAPLVTHGLSDGADETSKSDGESTSTPFLEDLENASQSKEMRSKLSEKAIQSCPEDLRSVNSIELLQKYNQMRGERKGKKSLKEAISIYEVSYACKLLFGEDWTNDNIPEAVQTKMTYAIWLRVNLTNKTCLKDCIDWDKAAGSFTDLRKLHTKIFRENKPAKLMNEMATRVHFALYDSEITGDSLSQIEYCNNKYGLFSHDSLRIVNSDTILEAHLAYPGTLIREIKELEKDESEKGTETYIPLGTTPKPLSIDWVKVIVRVLGAVTFTPENFHSTKWNCRNFSFLFSKALLGPKNFKSLGKSSTLFEASNRTASILKFPPASGLVIATHKIYKIYESAGNNKWRAKEARKDVLCEAEYKKMFG